MPEESGSGVGAGDDLDPKKLYLVSGARLMAMDRRTAQNRPTVAQDEDNALQIDEVSVEGGTVMSVASANEGDGLTTEDVQELIDSAIAALPTMDLEVCIDGSAQTVTVLLPPG